MAGPTKRSTLRRASACRDQRAGAWSRRVAVTSASGRRWHARCVLVPRHVCVQPNVAVRARTRGVRHRRRSWHGCADRARHTCDGSDQFLRWSRRVRRGRYRASRRLLPRARNDERCRCSVVPDRIFDRVDWAGAPRRSASWRDIARTRWSGRLGCRRDPARFGTGCTRHRSRSQCSQMQCLRAVGCRCGDRSRDPSRSRRSIGS